ncbi:3-oxoacid CoA-transferase subunit B [Spirillospora sp. NPDC048911]|uniref:3-oxoacid CoA-transferase subunit B n=1 Tax=Spirillospora sp. NPDC048911 TaxID=3364527 RepID=UPI00371F9901
MAWTRDEIARRAAREASAGQYVNLGIGLPTLVANHLPGDADIVLHSENGLLGVGPYPLADEVDADLVNAGKETVTLVRNAACFDSAASFAMIRGGHIDVAILGAMQVAANGDLANWTVPGSLVRGMGGAMDLVAGAKKVLILTAHTDKHGRPKLVSSCTMPLTGRSVAHRVITDLGVLDIAGGEFVLTELAPGVNVQNVLDNTDAPVRVALRAATT